jgi:hypothetical protein
MLNRKEMRKKVKDYVQSLTEWCVGQWYYVLKIGYKYVTLSDTSIIHRVSIERFYRTFVEGNYDC